MTVILGAGLTGLSVAYHLSKENIDFVIIDEEENPGGLCRNLNLNGYTFNYTGHFLHCKTQYVQDLARELIPDIKRIKRNSYIYLNKRIIPYPIQSNKNYLSSVSRIKSLIGYLFRNRQKPLNLEDWFIYNFGRGLYNIFFLPYNEKLWKYPLNKISPDFLTSYVPGSSSEYSKKTSEYNAEFLYPEKGIGTLIASISKDINISKGEVTRVEKNYVCFNGEKIKYENLVSTIPLPELLKMLYINGEVYKLKKNLVWNSVLCINMGIKGELSFGDSVKKIKGNNLNPSKFHWIYFPEKEIPFYRVGSLSNILPTLAPENNSSVWVEISYRENKPEDSIVDAVIKNLEQVGLFKKEAIEYISKLDIPYAYPIYDMKREGIIKEIQSFLKKHNIILAGRFGAWKYSYMEESILDGKRIAEEICR